MFTFLRRNPWLKVVRKSKRRGARRLAVRAGGPERLEDRTLLSATPWGAMPDDTGEFLLGDVYVTVVFMESQTQTSSVNDNSETWTPSYRKEVQRRIDEGLRWWKDTLAGITDKHSLSFQIDYTYADHPVSTSYEPITRPSTDFQFWIYDFLKLVGYNSTGNYSSDIRAFNHAQREANGANWAFTIFVVNDQNDADGKFAPGGFDKAFAFAGGRFFVTPAGRPASTYAHEMGHMFWALDEYSGGGDFNKFRGYYNTQNTNAWDNPTPGFVQQPSIMATGNCEDGGGLLCTAYTNHTSSKSSLEMVGWRDSDGDGVFDVLDVPHTLSGTGYYEAAGGKYRFIGQSSVQALPNLNPRVNNSQSESLQNDITINKISRAQYRIDGGAWQTAATYGTYTASLNLTIPVPAGSREIEIRTIDDTTGITSPIFKGGMDRPASTLMPGINGFVWDDRDGDGQWDQGEVGLQGWTVQLVDQNSQPLTLVKGVEPDNYPSSSTLLNNVIPEVRLKAIGSGVSDDSVFSLARSPASTGSQVFANFSGGINSQWTPATRQLRMDFTSPVTTVSLDAIADTGGDRARLEIYDNGGRLLARYTTKALNTGQAETMTLSRPTADIAYAIARGHAESAVHLDNLRFGPASAAVTGTQGAYSLAYLAPGQYTVRVVAAAGAQPTSPTGAKQAVTVGQGQPLEKVDFGFKTTSSQWQNPNNRLDVDNDGFVSPIDVLAIINDLNKNGARQLTSSNSTPPFCDVNGDGYVSPVDALQVINHINSGGASEGEIATPSWVSAGANSASAEIAAATGSPLTVGSSRHGAAATQGSDAPLTTAGAEGERSTQWQDGDRAGWSDFRPSPIGQNPGRAGVHPKAGDFGSPSGLPPYSTAASALRSVFCRDSSLVDWQLDPLLSELADEIAAAWWEPSAPGSRP